ncbi:MAG: DNA methyltransferase [Promethearchaeota archaeon]
MAEKQNSKDDEIKTTLIQTLKEIFQFDKNDLDFGIYRILNIKKKEIASFIEEDLFKIIEQEIKVANDSEALQKEIEGLSDEIEKEFGCELQEAREKMPNAAKIVELAKLEKNLEQNQRSLESHVDIFNHLIEFFSRYYNEGDFISKRRFSKENKYAIPYNGEEVYLYWTNHDQYYIKTAENFTNYSFKAGEWTINFEITGEDIDIEKANIKDPEDKYFIFYDLKQAAGQKLNIYFGYRGLTEEEKKNIMDYVNKNSIRNDYLIDYNIGILQEKLDISLIPELKEKHQKLNGDFSEKTELEWHLTKFTTKNTSDYFIHKDLEGFLTQELDFYIKNEIFDFDNINDVDELEMNFKKIKAFKTISLKIITFLAQIEEFQKKLWEKKKFILTTEYLITLDYIDEKYYPEILKNTAQINEWKKLNLIDLGEETSKKSQKTLDTFQKSKNEFDIDVLKSNPTLMVDTKFFDDKFKYDIFYEIENNEENITGILINSDNYHGLNLIFKKFAKKIKCFYIDPPYNSKSSEIIYKNTFKHSSWLSLMDSRIFISKFLLKEEDGIFIVAIDENEQEKLGLLLESHFPDYKKTCVSIIHNPGGIQGNNFSYSHEYAYFIYPDKPRMMGLNNREENPDIRPLRNVSKGAHLRKDAATCFYPILVKDQKVIGFGDVSDDDFHPRSVNIEKENGIIEIFPIDPKGIERKWTFSRDTVESIIDELSVEYNKSRKIWDIIRKKTKFNYKTVWDDKKFNANIYGSKILGHIFGDSSVFSFPKSVYNVKECLNAATYNDKKAIIIDFFAGSGTSGHAVMKLNKEDNGNRKFILIEMGNYFNTVLKPRIEKIIFTDNWKDGKPIDNKGSPKQIIKYQSLEQYEDSLQNIDFKVPNTLAIQSKDYKIKYMLDFESKDSPVFLNLDLLDNPFDYKIKIETKNGIKTQKVDLIETFNYIAGIFVDSIKKTNNDEIDYVIVKGHRDEKNIIVIWRNKPESFDPEKDKKFIEEKVLNDGEYDEILVNGNSLVENAKSLDEMFKKGMFGWD